MSVHSAAVECYGRLIQRHVYPGRVEYESMAVGQGEKCCENVVPVESFWDERL